MKMVQNFLQCKNRTPNYVMEHVRSSIGNAHLMDVGDKPWWTKTSSGCVSVKVLGIYYDEKRNLMRI